MKNFILLLFILVTTFPLKSQDSMDVNTGYVSLDLGAIGGTDVLILGFDGSLGYQWTKWVGGGLSLKRHLNLQYNSSAFSAFTLQYRVLPTNWLIFEVEYGWIIDHSDTDDIFLLEYVPGNYNVLHVYAGVKLNSWLTLGLSTTQPDDVKYRVCADYSADSFAECNDIRERYYEWYPLGLLFNVGVVIR